MIEFEKMYGSLLNELADNQKKLDINCALGIFFGLSHEGNPRLSFLSTVKPPKIESTKLISVYQGKESKNVYWTCFDLLNEDIRKTFFVFCGSLIDAVETIEAENVALQSLKTRYTMWKSMFKDPNAAKVSRESVMGLFGELYFLNEFMIDRFGVRTAVASWGGPEPNSKDFSTGTDWYEVKTVGANATKINISSLTQLSSDYIGKLVVIKAESMAESFDNGKSNIGELLNSIIGKIEDEDSEEQFLMKLTSCGIDLNDSTLAMTFDVKSVHSYIVDDKFPRLTENNIGRQEICDVKYSLILNSLIPYLEENV